MASPDKMMKRIGLYVEAGTSPDNYTLTPEAVPMEFIYGTNSGGLTKLEIFLDDMEVGASKELQLPGSDVESFFGCCSSQLMQGIKNMYLKPENFFLRLRLATCDEVDPREIVKAISQALTHGGCGGSCGCGCG